VDVIVIVIVISEESWYAAATVRYGENQEVRGAQPPPTAIPSNPEG
jgi:hypothetical protein